MRKREIPQVRADTACANQVKAKAKEEGAAARFFRRMRQADSYKNGRSRNTVPHGQEKSSLVVVENWGAKTLRGIFENENK